MAGSFAARRSSFRAPSPQSWDLRDFRSGFFLLFLVSRCAVTSAVRANGGANMSLDSILEALTESEKGNTSRSVAATLSSKFCGPGMKLTFDDMKAKNPTCQCECPSSECLKRTCPPDFAEENGKCLRYDTHHHEAVEAVHDKLECPFGQRPAPAAMVEIASMAGGFHTCYYECDCPETNVGAHHTVGGCQCTYQVDCEYPLELEVIEGKAWCTRKAVPAWKETVREEVETIDACPDGYEPEEDECVKYVEVQVDAMPPHEQALNCPDGTEPELCGGEGKVRCYGVEDCPEVTATEGTEVTGCEVVYNLDCTAPMQLETASGRPVCAFEGAPAHTKTERETIDSIEVCPSGFDMEGSACVRYEEVQHEEEPARQERLECLAGGSLTPLAPPVPARAETGVPCYGDCDCPDASHPGLELENCECRYDVVCEEPLELQMLDGEPWCYLAGQGPRTEHVVKEAEVVYTCPTGASYDQQAGKCVAPAKRCPTVVQVELGADAVACGPKTPEYIGHMFRAIYAANLMNARHHLGGKFWPSCVIGCISSYAKFSECAWQDDPETCVGRAGKSGKAIRAIGSISAFDRCNGKYYKQQRWLRASPACKAELKDEFWLRKSKKFLPCKDMYGSEFNFKSNWAEAISTIEEIAMSNYLSLSGSYVNKPVGRMDCRKAHCRKAEANSAQGRHGDGRTMAMCIQTCSDRNPHKK